MEIFIKHIYKCSICGKEYETEAAAARCEAQTIVPSSLPCGTLVKLPIVFGPWESYGEVREVVRRGHLLYLRVACGVYGEQIYDFACADDDVKPACQLCLAPYDTLEEAVQCAKQGRPPPKFRMGDEVRIVPHQGKGALGNKQYRIAAILWLSAPELSALKFTIPYLDEQSQAHTSSRLRRSHTPVYHLPTAQVRTIWAEDELVSLEVSSAQEV